MPIKSSLLALERKENGRKRKSNDRWWTIRLMLMSFNFQSHRHRKYNICSHNNQQTKKRKEFFSHLPSRLEAVLEATLVASFMVGLLLLFSMTSITPSSTWEQSFAVVAVVVVVVVNGNDNSTPAVLALVLALTSFTVEILLRIFFSNFSSLVSCLSLASCEGSEGEVLEGPLPSASMTALSAVRFF